MNALVTHTGRFTRNTLRLAAKIIGINTSTGDVTALFSPTLTDKDIQTRPVSPQYPSTSAAVNPPVPPAAERRPMECQVSFRVNKDRTIKAAGYITDITTTHYKVLSYPSSEPKNNEWFPIHWVTVTRWA